MRVQEKGKTPGREGGKEGGYEGKEGCVRPMGADGRMREGRGREELCMNASKET